MPLTVEERVKILEGTLTDFEHLKQRSDADHIVCDGLKTFVEVRRLWIAITGVIGFGSVAAIITVLWLLIQSTIQKQVEIKTGTYIQDHAIDEIAKVLSEDVLRVAVIRQKAEKALPIINNAAGHEQLFVFRFTFDDRSVTLENPKSLGVPFVDVTGRQITFLTPPELVTAVSEVQATPIDRKDTKEPDHFGAAVVISKKDTKGCSLTFTGNNRNVVFAASGLIVAVGVPASIVQPQGSPP